MRAAVQRRESEKLRLRPREEEEEEEEVDLESSFLGEGAEEEGEEGEPAEKEEEGDGATERELMDDFGLGVVMLGGRCWGLGWGAEEVQPILRGEKGRAKRSDQALKNKAFVCCFTAAQLSG